MIPSWAGQMGVWGVALLCLAGCFRSGPVIYVPGDKFPGDVAVVSTKFPKELLPDTPHKAFGSHATNGAVSVLAHTKGAIEPMFEAYLPKLTERGWIEQPLPEEVFDWETPTIERSFKRGDESFECRFTALNYKDEVVIDLTYSNDALQTEYKNAVAAKIERFGEEEFFARAQLDGVFAVYAAFDSYRDKASLQVYDDAEGRIKSGRSDAKFASAYERSTSTFRFEYLEDEEYTRYILHGDRSGARSSAFKKVKEDTLDNTFSGAYGVCWASADVILPLLLWSETADDHVASDHGMLGHLVRVREGERAQVRGVDCYGILGIGERGDQFTVWVETKTNLIRQVRYLDTCQDEPRLSVYTFDPELDVALGRKDLEFQREGTLRAPFSWCTLWE